MIVQLHEKELLVYILKQLSALGSTDSPSQSSASSSSSASSASSSSIDTQQRDHKRRKLNQDPDSGQNQHHQGNKIRIFSNHICFHDVTCSSITKDFSISRGYVKCKVGKNGNTSLTWSKQKGSKQFTILEIGDIENEQTKSELTLLAKASKDNNCLMDFITISGKRQRDIGYFTIEIEYALDYVFTFANVAEDILNELVNYIFKGLANLNMEQEVSVEFFYKCILEHTGKLPLCHEQFDLPDLKTKLLNFQRKTVQWMLTKESALYDLDTGRCEQIIGISASSLNEDKNIIDTMNKIWYGWREIEFNGQQLCFNILTSHLSTIEHLRSYLLEYLKETDKNLYPTILPAKGLLCEEMGLGKTVESTALILLNPRPAEDIGKRISRPLYIMGDHKSMYKAKTTLIIAPNSIIQQWQDEITRLAPSLTVTEYKGIKSYKLMKNKPAIIAEYLGKFDVVFTSYTVLGNELNYANFSKLTRKTRAAKKEMEQFFNEESVQEVLLLLLLLPLPLLRALSAFPGKNLNQHTEEKKVDEEKEKQEKQETQETQERDLINSASLEFFHIPDISTKTIQPNSKMLDASSETFYEEALQREVALALEHNKIPDWYHKIDYACPLMLMQFWRVLLDEVQMVSLSSSKCFKSAELIPRFHSWGVSGTPIKRDLDDLQSYLKFLHYYPFDSIHGKKAWKLLISDSHKFQKFWSEMSLRHTKAMVEHDIRLPPQNRIRMTIPFNPVEQNNYDTRFAECLQDIGLDSEGNPTQNDWEMSTDRIQKMKTWLRNLRQLCCSPQFSSLNINRFNSKAAAMGFQQLYFVDTLKSLDDLLDEMLDKVYFEIAEKEKRKLELVIQSAEFLEFIYQPKHATKFLKEGIIETRKIIHRLRLLLQKLIEDYRKDRNKDAKDKLSKQPKYDNNGDANGDETQNIMEVDDAYNNIDHDDNIGTSQESDSYNGENKLEHRVSNLRIRLKNWHLLLHKLYFLYASANFQLYDPEFQLLIAKYQIDCNFDTLYKILDGCLGIDRADELAGIMSSMPKSYFFSVEDFVELPLPQKTETEFYKKAEDIRDEYLKPSLKYLQKVVHDKIQNRGLFCSWKSTFHDDGTKLIPKNSKKLFNVLPLIRLELDKVDDFGHSKCNLLLEKSAKLITALNVNAHEVNPKIYRLVELLIELVVPKEVEMIEYNKESHEHQQNGVDEKENGKVDVNGPGNETTENIYDWGLQKQQQIEDLLSDLGKLISERKLLLLGNTGVYNSLLSSRAEDLNFTTMMVELGSIEYSVNEPMSSKSSKISSPAIVQFTNLAKKLRNIFENQKTVSNMITREVNLNFNAIFNARVEYFKQLQQISDSVLPPTFIGFDREKLKKIDVELKFTRLEKSFVEQNRLIENSTGRLRYLSELVKESSSNNADDFDGAMMCIICRCEITSGSLTKCGHKFCKECLQHWMRNSQFCPMCKDRIQAGSVYNFNRFAQNLKAAEETTSSSSVDSFGVNMNSIYKPVDQSVVDEIQDIKLWSNYSSKVDMIVKQALYLRTKDRDVQIVVFSQWRRMLSILAIALNASGVTCATLGTKQLKRPRGGQGAMHLASTRTDPVELFKNPANKITCFLLDANAQASGLTLTNATHIFLCEPLINTSLELQAISRVHRIGQTRPTTVWMFTIANTVEESVVLTATRKRLNLIKETSQDNGTIVVNEHAMSIADSLTLNKSNGQKSLLEKRNAEGENVNSSDLWDAFFSSNLNKC